MVKKLILDKEIFFDKETERCFFLTKRHFQRERER